MNYHEQKYTMLYIMKNEGYYKELKYVYHLLLTWCTRYKFNFCSISFTVLSSLPQGNIREKVSIIPVKWVTLAFTHPLMVAICSTPPDKFLHLRGKSFQLALFRGAILWNVDVKSSKSALACTLSKESLPLWAIENKIYSCPFLIHACLLNHSPHTIMLPWYSVFG